MYISPPFEKNSAPVSTTSKPFAASAIALEKTLNLSLPKKLDRCWKVRTFLYISILLIAPGLLCAKQADPEGSKQPPKVGNFSLPSSQQPGPLISFGQNVIDAGLVQFSLFTSAAIGKNNYSTIVIPSAIYGITEDFSCTFSIPFSPGNQERSHHSSGMEDISAEFEYAFFDRSTRSAEEQATIVAGITFPTGSASKDPPTGFGSNSYFLGATFNHTEIHWLFFTSHGAVLTTSKHGTQFGDQLLYEFGFGRTIPSPVGWIFAWIVEFDGVYAWKDRIERKTDPNSGGNTIYLTPSVSFANKRLIVQFGAGYPIVQHLFGHQPKQYLSLNLDIEVTF